MTVPITQPGNAEAKETRPPQDSQAVDMGEGHIFGNLTENPELRFTPTGRPVAKLRVCYRPRIKDDASGKWHDGEPEFYTINVWGRQAENAAECFIKGDRIVAAGSWVKRPWTTREGEQRESIELTAKDIGPSLLFKQAVITRPDDTPEAPSDNT